MTDNEKIILIMKFAFEIDFVLRNQYMNELNNYLSNPGTAPEDVLKVYKAKIRYEAFREFTADLDKILYGK